MQGDRARSALSGSRFGDVRWVEETGSTNQDLRDLATAGAPDGLVLVADHQTAGRGRLDRAWEAPVGGSLLVSVLVRPQLEPGQSFLLTAAMAMAAAGACAALTPVRPAIKWPNDLVAPAGAGGYEGRKLGGVLAEAVLDQNRLAAVVIGLGLNVDWPAELPPELADLAVALNHLVGYAVDREELLVELLGRLADLLSGLDEGDGGDALLAGYRELSATLGRPVRVHLPHETFEGEALDITPEGHLLVSTGDRAEPREVLAGDVVHLRHT